MRSTFTYNPYIGFQDEHAKLEFFRCDGESVNTTIEVERFTQDDPDLVLDVSIESQPMSYDCKENRSRDIENSGDKLGYVNFTEDCNKILIVFNPPPTLRALITIYVNMQQEDYGPYFIGQEGECCEIHHINCKCFKIV